MRNLDSVQIDAHPRLNFLYGDNGAGKTSLLEAIAILSRGRSFRTSQASELSGPGGKSFQVFAQTVDDAGNGHRMGLERSGSHWRARLNGVDVAQLSQMTRMLPLVVMEPDSHLLVSGPPEVRRRYLDWGMFHVEHHFLDVARRYAKALKQRNAALRRGQNDVLDSIDRIFSELGERLSKMRQIHCSRLSETIGSTMKDLSGSIGAIELTYHSGWKGERLAQALSERRTRDLERGTSSVGPHRAELELLCDGRPARMVFSRGEQKVLSAAMLLTQLDLLASAGERPVLLLDDLVSEFDRLHHEKVLDKARASGSQVWITGTAEPQQNEESKVFHVERGTVRELL